MRHRRQLQFHRKYGFIERYLTRFGSEKLYDAQRIARRSRKERIAKAEIDAISSCPIFHHDVGLIGKNLALAFQLLHRCRPVGLGA